MKNLELEKYLNDFLNVSEFSDYAPNGLQVEGRVEIRKIISGVTACEALIDAAIEKEADAILVHHGYFWRGEDQRVINMKRNRLKKLLANDINLYAYHLPLDAHPELGNNAQLASLLGLNAEGTLQEVSEASLVWYGSPSIKMTATQFSHHIANKLQREPLHIDGGRERIDRIAWCTGGAQDFISQAADAGADAYLTGEASECTVHIARERGIHFFAAGHHATEKFGVQALGKHLAEKFTLSHEFIDIENPV